MPTYICHQCGHELHADEQTLIYLINHPPKCVGCGFEETDLREAKARQFAMQIKKKGFSRTIRLYNALYHSGKEDATTYLSRVAVENKIIFQAKTKKKAAFAVFWIILLFSLGAGFLPLFIDLFSGPDLYCRDLSYIPSDKGGAVWSLYSVGTDENKIRILANDPITGDELMKRKLETEFPLTSGNLIYHNNKVWMIGNNYSAEAMIYVLNATDGGVLMTTSQFLSAGGKLQSGLAQMYYYPPYGLALTGKDGQFTYYSIDLDRYFDTQDAYNRYHDSVSNGPTTYFELQWQGSSGHISNLFFVHGSTQPAEPEKEVAPGIYIYYPEHSETEPIHTQISQRNFLDAQLLYKDKDIVLIQHLSELGANATTLYSCYDKKGKQLFEADQYQFLPDGEKDNEDWFYKLSATRYEKMESLFLIHFSTYGLAAIDLEKGTILWKYWTED
jgi:hypothetical protein